MSDIKKIATRDSYGNALKKLGGTYDDLFVLDADLSKATKTEVFHKAFPERFINVGIAEGNMMGIAAGLASTGKVVFASTFAMFAAGRGFEQIRNSIAYPNLNVKVAATHGGISVGEDGASHQCNEDFALMRSIPNMVVISPADDIEAMQATEAAYHHYGPVYLRFGRLAVPVVNREDYKFELGKGVTLREGSDVTVVATGLMVNEALIAAEELAKNGVSVRVINIHTIKPIDKEIIIKAAQETKFIVTAEEHSIFGGLGDAVSHVCGEHAPTKVLRVGVQDEFGRSGPAAPLLKLYGLSSEAIINKIQSNL